MSDAPVSEAVAVLNGDMTECEPLPFAGGQAVVFSARSPAKSTANEDAAVIVPSGDFGGVLAVADGCGGHFGGDQAAAIAVTTIHDLVSSAPEKGQSLRESVMDSFEEANRRIAALGIGAATTLALVEVQEGTARAYHCGDSSIIITGQRGRVKLESLAHAPVAYAVEAGVLDPVEALHHEDRSLISNIVGAPDMRIDVGSAIELAARDTVLIASDGLTDNLSVAEIVTIIRKGPLKEAGDALARLCRDRMVSTDPAHPAAQDDLTFVLFRRTA